MVVISEGPLQGRTGKIERVSKNKIIIRIEQLGMCMVAEVHKNKVEQLQAAV